MEDYLVEDLEDKSASKDSDDIFFEDYYDIQDEFFHLDDKQTPVSITDILDKASRFIFAEDLVSYIASEFHGLIYSYKVKAGSKTLSSSFNETIKDAVRIIRWQINKRNCSSFEIIKKLSKSNKFFYENFVDAILGHYSEKGLKAGVFLNLCVYFAELASKCYRSDFEELLDFAVYAILDAFCMLNEGRYELNNFAKTIKRKLKDRGFYLDLWSTQIENLHGKPLICEKPPFRKYFCSQEKKVEENKVSQEQLSLVDNSDKCDAIRNFDFAINKFTKNGKSDQLEEYRTSLERLQLEDKSNRCEIINNLEFATDEIMKKNQDNEIEKYRASLEQLRLVDKSEKCEAVSNLELSVNKIEENSKNNELKESVIALQRLHLVDKSNNCEFVSDLEFDINKNYENNQENEMEEYKVALKQSKLVDKCKNCEFLSNEVKKYDKYESVSDLQYAQNKATESRKENEFEEYLTALEKLRLVDKSENYEVLSNLKFDARQHCKTCRVNDFEEYRASVEELKVIDKFAECAVRNNLKFDINKNIEAFLKPAESNDKLIEFSSSKDNSEDCIALLIRKLCLTECEKLYSASENHVFEDCLQEVMSVVHFEAVLFSEMYLSQDKHVKSVAQTKSHFLNEKRNIESSKCSRFCNSLIRDSNTMSKQDENCLQAPVRSNSALTEHEKEIKFEDFNYELGHSDVEFPNSLPKESEFQQDQLIPQTHTVKSDKNSIAELSADFTQLELESVIEDASAVLDHSSVRQVVHDINAETHTSDIANSALTHEQNERKSEDFSIFENKDIKFANIEYRGVELRQDQLISQRNAENCDENASTQDVNFTNLDYKKSKYYDFTVDVAASLSTQVDDKPIVELFVIYKQEGEINEENLKVLKGGSLLFAEDLIKYIAKEFYGISYSESKFDEIHHLSSNALNETLKATAHFIHDESEIVNSMVSDFISNLKGHRTDWYTKYATAIMNNFVEDGLKSEEFIYYCLHFSDLALKLHSLDHPEFFDFAISSILDLFCLLKDDWNELNVAVENILELFKTRRDDKKNSLLCLDYVDKLEKKCVNTIFDLLKGITDKKIEDIYLNNFMTFKNIGPPLQLEMSNRDDDVSEQS